MVSLTLLYTISLTPKMLQAEIAAVLQCALLLNSHHRNTVALRRKQGVCVSSAPENRLIWCWKCGVIGKALAKTPPTPGVERGPLFCQEIDHPLHFFPSENLQASSLSCHRQRTGSIGMRQTQEPL